MHNVRKCSVLCLLLSFVYAGCGEQGSVGSLEQSETVNAGIINGNACRGGEFNTAVAILVDAEVTLFGVKQELRAVGCTGTLIAPDVVLAAAHCFDPALFTMGMGKVHRLSYSISFADDISDLMEQKTKEFPNDAIKASFWVSHKGFDLNNFAEVNGPGNFKDIGLLFLSEAVLDREPEILITPEEASQIQSGAVVGIAGWGQQTMTNSMWEPPPPGTVGIKQCARSFINDIGSYEMQIGGDLSTSRKCHGDSGGPTYLMVDTDSTKKRRVIGITSHAYDMEDCKIPKLSD
jgi:hypothetical protein